MMFLAQDQGTLSSEGASSVSTCWVLVRVRALKRDDVWAWVVESRSLSVLNPNVVCCSFTVVDVKEEEVVWED